MPVVDVIEDKPSCKAVGWTLLLWAIALACMLGGATMWIFGSVGIPYDNSTPLQVMGNVVVAYLPVAFCAVGACKCLAREKQLESIV